MKLIAPLVLAAAVAGVASPSYAGFSWYTSKSAFNSATPTTVVEDFEGVAAASLNTPLASFSRNGLTYTPFAGAPFPNVFIAGAPVDYTNFGADVPVVGGTQLTSHVMTANGDEDIEVDFSAPVLALGMDVYFNGLGLFDFGLLDKNHVNIGSLGAATGNDPATGLADEGFIGVVSTFPIYGFRFTTTLGGRLNTGFDNIALGPALTPEPGTWGLMIAGFGLAGAALRRRRALAA